MSWPLVTVNLLAFNRRDDVATSLEHLTGSLDYPAEQLEIVVVDNGSSDGTSEMIAERFPQVHVHRREDNIGIPAWNDGFARGRGEFFLVLDDDCYLDGDGLKRAVLAAQDQNADLVSFKVASPYVKDYFFNDDYNPGLLTFWGCAALVSRKAVDRLKGFDPNIFIWAHELEFTTRVLDAGMSHLYLPDVVAIHMTKPPFRGESGFVTNTRNLAYVIGKALRPRDAFVAYSWLWLRALLTIARRRTGVKGLRGLVEGLRAGLEQRQPLRAEVSTAYRRNFKEFTNPLLLLRGPGARLRGIRADAATLERDRAHVQTTFYAARPTFYPQDALALKL